MEPWLKSFCPQGRYSVLVSSKLLSSGKEQCDDEDRAQRVQEILDMLVH